MIAVFPVRVFFLVVTPHPRCFAHPRLPRVVDLSVDEVIEKTRDTGYRLRPPPGERTLSRLFDECFRIQPGERPSFSQVRATPGHAGQAAPDRSTVKCLPSMDDDVRSAITVVYDS